MRRGITVHSSGVFQPLAKIRRSRGRETTELRRGRSRRRPGVADLNGNMYFTSGDRITKRDASGKVSVFREPSGGANGLLFDKQGRLIVCEAKNRRVVRNEANGELTVLTDKYEGHEVQLTKRLNHRFQRTDLLQ